MDDIVFGFLDCSKYGKACSRWGRVAPSLEIYRHDNGQRAAVQFKDGAKKDEINADVKKALENLLSLSEAKPTPEPPVITPKPKPTIVPNVKIIIKSNLENRSFDDVKSKWKSLYGGAQSNVVNSPWTAGTGDSCNVGTHNEIDATHAFNTVNFYRYLYGVDNLTIDQNTYKEGCMQAALVFNKMDDITHSIPTDANCYTKAAEEAAKYSQLAKGPPNAYGAVDNFIEDKEDHNRQLGHRRGVLSHIATKMGIGMTTKGVYGNRTDQLRGFTVLRIDKVGAVGNGRTPIGDGKFYAFPNPGPFPASLTPQRWHIQSDLFADGSGIKADDVEVRVIRSDGIAFSISDKFIDHEANSGDALIFYISAKDVELSAKDYSVTVQAYIKSRDTAIEYTIAFKDFDAEPATGICFYNTKSASCPSGTTKFGPGQYEQKESNDANQIVYVVDDIKLEKNLSANFAKTIVFTGSGRIDGTIKIPANRNVLFDDASLTTFSIDLDYSLNETSAGHLSSGISPKSILINFVSTVDMKFAINNTRYHIYEGPNALVEMAHPDIQLLRGFLIFGYQFYSDEATSNRLIVSSQYIPTTKEFFNGAVEDGMLTIYDDLPNFKDDGITTRFILHMDNKNSLEFSELPDLLMDYELDVGSSRDTSAYLKLTYDPKLKEKMRSIKIITGYNIYFWKEECKDLTFEIFGVPSLFAPEGWTGSKYTSDLPQFFPIPFEPSYKRNGSEFIKMKAGTNIYFEHIIGDVPSNLVPYSKIKKTHDFKNDVEDIQNGATFEVKEASKIVNFDSSSPAVAFFAGDGAPDEQEITIKYGYETNSLQITLMFIGFKSLTVKMDKVYSPIFYIYKCGAFNAVPEKEGDKITASKLVKAIEDADYHFTTFSKGITASSGATLKLTNCVVSGPLTVGDSTINIIGGSVTNTVTMNILVFDFSHQRRIVRANSFGSEHQQSFVFSSCSRCSKADPYKRTW